MSRGLDRLRDVLDEARCFLALPRLTPKSADGFRRATVPGGSPESARRLFAMSRPVSGTIAEAYLRKRGITALHRTTGALRFHPRCYYRPHAGAQTGTWPALIAAVTDLTGNITGAHRTYLDPSGAGKAAIETPRRAMGQLLGNGVRTQANPAARDDDPAGERAGPAARRGTRVPRPGCRAGDRDLD